MQSLSNAKLNQKLMQIRTAAREGKVKMAPADKVTAHAALLHDFMEHIVGCTGYLLTDWSSIDEWRSEDEDLHKVYAKKIKDRYGVRMKIGTKNSYYIGDILERLAMKIAELPDDIQGNI